MKKGLFIFMFGIIFLSGFVLAASNIQPGGPPKVFSGNIYINGIPLEEGEYSLRAVINGEPISILDITNYEYENLQVSTGNSNYYGEIIFMINGVESLNKSSWNNYDDERGQKVILDLHFDKEIPSNDPCGNGDLDSNAGEQCDRENFGPHATCESVMLYYYGQSGYTGELGCTPKCTYDTSSCIAPVQEEETPNNPPANNNNNGGGGGGDSSTTTSTNNDVLELSVDVDEDNNEETIQTNDKDSGKGITGSAISDFSKTTGGKILIVVLSLIILGLVLVLVKKKLKK